MDERSGAGRAAVRRWLVAIGLGMIGLSASATEVIPAMMFRPGEIIRYRSAQDTTARTVANGREFVAHSRVRLFKEWTVQEVAADGSARLQLVLRHLAMDQTAEGGQVRVFDSADLTGSDPSLRDELGQLVNQPILRVALAADGRVLESVPLQGGQQLVTGLPFHLILPPGGITSTASWRSRYQAESPSPLPGQETPRFTVVQENRVVDQRSGRWLVISNSTLADPPAQPAEQLGTLSFYKEGKIVLEAATGQMVQAELTVGRRVDNFAGPGSSYTLQDRYTEHRDQPLASSR